MATRYEFRSNRAVSLVVKLEGATKRITFRPHSQGGSIYSTSDAEEIKALKGSRAFASHTIYVTGETEVKEVRAEAAAEPQTDEEKWPDKEVVHGVATVMAASKWLRTNKQYAGPTNTREAVMAAAEQCGVVFPDMNK